MGEQINENENENIVSAEHFLPVYRETTQIKNYTLLSEEELLLKNRELNVWLMDPFITDRQRKEVQRIQEHIVFEIHSRIKEGTMARQLGKVVIAKTVNA